MSLDGALAAIPALIDEVRALRAELRELRAVVTPAEDEWSSQAAWARRHNCSADTVARKIVSGELEVMELGRAPLTGKDGKQLVDKKGTPRWRRTLRVRLARRPSDAEISEIATAARTSS